jgi:diacylglycerol kinase
MGKKNFSIIKRLRSFRFAFNGLKILILEEHNSRIHLVIGTCAIIAGFILNISGLEWVAIILSIGFVFSFELINSAIENISDYISPGTHKVIEKVKDLAAASVLICSITAFAIGLIVFLPKIFELF